MGVVEKLEGAAKEHKKGNQENASAGAVEGKFISVGKLARECQLETEVGCNGLGFSTHTPIANKTMCGNSPQTINSTTSNNFKFYSRTRWHQRQKTVGCLKEQHFLVNRQQQQRAENDKGASPNNGHLGQKIDIPITQDLQNTKHFTSQLVEAEAIWNMAKVMGMTGEIDQERLINRIEEMEERDLKEAERLGARTQNP